MARQEKQRDKTAKRLERKHTRLNDSGPEAEAEAEPQADEAAVPADDAEQP